MRKFWGFYQNGKYKVGCNGTTVYIYDNDDTELAKFKDISYAYTAKFMPNANIIAVKSTEGFLAFYNLDELKLIKKITITRIGAQDEGFAFSPDGKYFYNIEKPTFSTKTQLTIYSTVDFSLCKVLFKGVADMHLCNIEFDSNGNCYVLGFMRDSNGVYDYGFVGELTKDKIRKVKKLDEETYNYIHAYIRWEEAGFTEKSLEWNYTLKSLDVIKPISIKEVFMSK